MKTAMFCVASQSGKDESLAVERHQSHAAN